MARIRSISEELEAKIRAAPEIATRLASEHEACDFERTTYVARWEDSAGHDPARRAKARERGLALADKVAAEHAATWKALIELGVQQRDVDVALEIGRAGLGLSWGLSDTAATFLSSGGAAVGDDVGLGPTRMFSASETHAIFQSLQAQSISQFSASYARSAPEASDPFESFELVVAARVSVTRYPRNAKIIGRALLVWHD
jgi:hypothetical protein